MLLITAILALAGAICFFNDDRVYEIVGVSLLFNVPIALAFYLLNRSLEKE